MVSFPLKTHRLIVKKVNSVIFQNPTQIQFLAVTFSYLFLKARSVVFP